jgi:hypothetical protein
VEMWETGSGCKLWETAAKVPNKTTQLALAFSGDESLVVIGGPDCKARAYETISGRAVGIALEHRRRL